ncbi:MAG: M23 family metallopeptidase [Clostridia bacterium]|nr:M23 family metallopeptidase [Clostridia bacterium]
MKKLLPLILAVIICVPAVIAIISYNNAHADPPDVGTVTTMTLTTLAGREYTFKSEEDAEIIDIFTAMMQETTKVSSLPVQFSGRHYTAVFSTKSDTYYKFYMTTNPEVCYYTDDYGIYKLKPANAQKFLATPYASDLYTTAAYPTLTLSGQDVLPTSLEWSYETYSGHYARVDEAGLVTTEPLSFELTGGIDLSFSVEPDYCEVAVTSTADGVEFFRGSLDRLSTIDLKDKGPVSIRIDADYPNVPGCDAYGHIVYEFSAEITTPAAFYLSTTSFNVVGGVVAVSGYHIADPSAITFQSEPAMNFVPTFFAVPGEAYCVALIPLPYGTEPGTYLLHFTYGGVTDTLEMRVRKFNRTIEKIKLNVSQAMYESYYSETARDAFAADIAAAVSMAVPEQLSEGAFELLYKHKTIEVMYAQTRTVYASKTSTGDKYTQESLIYKQKLGTDVTATNSGSVCYAGHTDFGGYTVIIEHGYGLKTWYMHLDSISVSAGDNVAKGQVIGQAGHSGFFTSDYDGVEYAMSVFGTFFAPYDLWPDSDDKAWRNGIPFATE